MLTAASRPVGGLPGFVLTATLALSACAYPPATAPIPGGSPPATTDRGTLFGYGQALEFRTRLGAADVQYVDESILAAIEPQVGSYKISRADLAEGRIVARFRKAASGSLRRFALLAGDTVSYWLVYQQGDDYYGRFISASFDTTYQIAVDWHTDDASEMLAHNLEWEQAIAQWRVAAPWITGGPARRGGVNSAVVPVVARGTVGWVTCTAYGCCKTDR